MLQRKLTLLAEFCYSSFQNCFQFLKSDPIEQSGQISQYQTTNQQEKQQKRQTLEHQYNDIEDQDQDNNLIDNDNPFEQLKPTLNFSNSIQQQTKSDKQQQLKYEEEMVDVNTQDGHGWHHNQDEIENENIEL